MGGDGRGRGETLARIAAETGEVTSCFVSFHLF